MINFYNSRYKSLRRSANLFVLNLAVGDTLLIVANVPLLVISSFRAQWIGGVIGKNTSKQN